MHRTHIDALFVAVLVGVLFGPVVVGRIKANMAVIFPASRLAVYATTPYACTPLNDICDS